MPVHVHIGAAAMRIAEPDATFREVAKAPKTDALVAYVTRNFAAPRSILVVGCGSGLEAGALARAFDATTIGIDICDNFAFDHVGAAPAELKIMDARALDFADACFDLVYSFHALEHIPDPRLALAEMARVLRPGGHFIVGTPNRSRAFGYFGAPHPFADKIRWNIADWRMRLAGRWTNEAGAHAGFSARELVAMTSAAFGRSRDISGDYYRLLYPRHAAKVGAIERAKLTSLLYPCVYVGA